MPVARPIRLLHFADAHIDIANYGRHDPETALPVRVMDFLRSLDTIVDTAVSEQVDLVIFAGDAYKDRNPHPTYQREWGRRIMKLANAGIPTVLLVGNHDVSPASGRAHTLHEYDTLGIAHVHVADRIDRLDPEALGVPVQVITMPWISRSQLMTREETAGKKLDEIMAMIEERVVQAVQNLVAGADPDLPLILTAHASVQGAKYGSERAVMLGHELVLSGGLVNDGRLDYVALGHIHKHQALHADGSHPPIVYPGSIERIDFGEAREEKGFVLAEVSRGQTSWEFVPLETRRFVDVAVETRDADRFMDDVMAAMPKPGRVVDAICRVQLTYPRDLEPLLDEAVIYDHFAEAFSMQLQKHRLLDKRARLGDATAVEQLSPTELLTTFWRTKGYDDELIASLETLAHEILSEDTSDDIV